MTYYGKFEIGENTFKLGLKKTYGCISHNVYGTINNPFLVNARTSFYFEEEAREFFTTNKSYPAKITLKNMVWMQQTNWSKPLLVYCESETKFYSYYRDNILNNILGEHTINHPGFLESYKGKAYTPLASYNSFLHSLWKHPACTAISSKMKNLIKQEKDAFATLVKENNWTKQDIAAYKEKKKKEIKDKLEAEKQVIYYTKEMDMVTKLSVSLASLIDEATEMQKYLADPDNRLNISHYESRLRKVKSAIKIIQKMKKES